MQSLFHSQSPFRIFAFSALSSLAILVAVLVGVGPAALLTTLILAVIEITFSFDNAIINAKVLDKVSKWWQTVFLSVGIIVAIFGMRILFPIVIVSVTAHLGWLEVLHLALHAPKEYAHHLEEAHASIAAFGGTFLLLLAFQFFFDDKREMVWAKRFERLLQRINKWWGAVLITAALLGLVALLPANDHAMVTLVAGGLGAVTYLLIQLVVSLLERLQPETGAMVRKQTGLAAFTTLIYLEILDASFSFDGVIGAFAVTNDVILIAAGLGIGALWVRSLTVFMVRRGTLGQYRFLEHGAHYTVFALAIILLGGIVLAVPDFVPGLLGVAIIGASIVASIRASRHA